MSYRWLLHGITAAVLLPTASLLLIYLISGEAGVKLQINSYGYFILALAIGFGTQVGLFSYLREKRRRAISQGAVAGSGAVSGLAMVACCTHYLTGLFPVLLGTGLITFATQWQGRFFWIGLLANFSGIIYLVGKLRRGTDELN